ncbi:putative IclR family transcriptional regulator [Caenibius tardaugens NBRC 16725]|uniref:Putative IclR family transcriptional regulator n=1 Tax=Caenibius tardaugens NBRC 16725 TaxID=1219035 RepID=U2YQC5_9SPHN|nr:IclR family transcriptional regulator [Caenibius tardaugens]AZI35260.1 IclR family transcriptional regulator [Caenibius tardaugens NBRC 16725]GAD51165.1 putative IclR family transcriptional regulator [Caenibius tardaugens NBRC 16725]
MSVKRAEDVLDLLEYLAARGRPTGVPEIAQDLGWPRSSAYRIINTLEQRGYLYETKARGGYYPSPRWIALADQFTAGFALPEFAQDLTRTSMERSGETVSIVAPAGPWAVFVLVSESAAPIRYFAKAGHRIPIHASASGRALLQQYDKTELRALLSRITFETYGATTPTDVDAVLTAIEQGKERRYQLNVEEFTPDLLGIAVPLPIEGRRFALVVSGPTYRMQAKVEELAELLLEQVVAWQ